MAASFLALLAALMWGTDDYIGGRLARRAPVAVVVFLAASVSSVFATAVALTLGIPETLGGALLWGAAGGIGSSLGAMALYRGLAIGRAAVVAPTAAVMGACFPVAVGVIGGDRPDAVSWLGIVLALPAIWLLSSTVGGGDGRSGLWYGVLGGIAFGWLFVALDLAPDGSGLWPVAASKVGSAGVAAGFLAATRTSPRVRARIWPGVLAIGVIDVGAGSAFLFATERGMLALVAVLASLYPAPTVALASIFGGERPSPRQLVGASMAVAAAALISV